MDFLGALAANVISILFLALVALGAAKTLQIASTLSEIKELLADIKRNTQNPAPAGSLSSAPITSMDSAERLLRAVGAELDHPVRPAAIELEHKS